MGVDVELSKAPVDDISKISPKDLEGSENGDHADERKGDDWHYSHGLTTAGEGRRRFFEKKPNLSLSSLYLSCALFVQRDSVFLSC